MDDAVLMLEDMIKKQAEYAYGILEPELTALAKALESVDATLLEKLDENPFQIVMDLLPKVETIEGLDLTQPEIAAMKAAYETALSVLNRMAGSADILKYMSIHEKTNENVCRNCIIKIFFYHVYIKKNFETICKKQIKYKDSL